MNKKASRITVVGLTIICLILTTALGISTTSNISALKNRDMTITGKDDEINRQNQQISNLQTKIQVLEEQNATLQSTIANLTSQITQGKKTITSLESQLDEIETSRNAKQNQIDALTSQISNIEQTLSANNNRIIQLENKVDGYEEEKVQIGIYPSGGEVIWKYEEELGGKFDHILQYQKVTSLNHTKIKTFRDKGYDVILTIEFTDSYANLHDIAAGKYDTYLTEFAETLKNDGRMIWLRPLHEFNADWYNWGVFYNGNKIEDFIPAWRHIVQTFRDHNAPVKFQLNYNRLSTNASTPFSAFWPGDEWVDLVSITSFNRAYTDQSHQYWHSFAEDFDNAYQQVIALTQKPIGVAETSSTSYNGSKPQWIIDTFNSIAFNYTRIQQVSWFLQNKIFNTVLHDWDLNTPEEKQAFTQGMDIVRIIIRD